MLVPLVVAHRARLGRLVEERRRAKERWRRMAVVLDEREAAIAGRGVETEQEEVVRGLTGREKAAEDTVRRRWKTNWLGDPRWLEIVLDGDSEEVRDRMLEGSFSEALQRVGETPPPPPSVSLKGLENQVEEQRKRVAEIRKLRELTTGVAVVTSGAALKLVPPPAPAADRMGLHVEFRKHQGLGLRDMAGLARRNRGHRSECGFPPKLKIKTPTDNRYRRRAPGLFATGDAACGDASAAAGETLGNDKHLFSNTGGFLTQARHPGGLPLMHQFARRSQRRG